MTTNQRIQIPIDTVILHTYFHLDEAEALRRSKGYGEDALPGITGANVRFTQGLKPQTDAVFDANKILPIGCGGGRFDEHRGEDERLEGECATTLVSKCLGLQEDSVLKQIADEVLRCDTERGVRNTELAEIIKMAHRRLEGNEIVLRWCMKVLHSLHSQLFANYARVTGEKTLEQLFAEMAKQNRFPDERARTHLGKLVAESMERKDKSITELAFLTECLYRTTTDGDAAEFVKFALGHMYNDQVAFWEAVEECKSGNWFHTSALCNHGRTQTVARLPVLSICSDNPLVQRAARRKEAGGAAVVIVRTKNGNTSVFVDDSKGINLTAFTRMVRWLELPKDKYGKLTVEISWDELGKEGKLKKVPQWYFFKKAEQLFNGSLTLPDVPPTQIRIRAIEEIAENAFHPGLFRDWMESRGIPIPKKERASPKVKSAKQAKTSPVKPVSAKAEISATAEPVEVKPSLADDLAKALNGNQIH